MLWQSGVVCELKDLQDDAPVHVGRKPAFFRLRIQQRPRGARSSVAPDRLRGSLRTCRSEEATRLLEARSRVATERSPRGFGKRACSESSRTKRRRFCARVLRSSTWAQSG